MATVSHTPQIRELDIDATARLLLQDATASEFDTATITSRGDELTDLRADLTARIEFLHTQLDITALPMLPTPPPPISHD